MPDTDILTGFPASGARLLHGETPCARAPANGIGRIAAVAVALVCAQVALACAFASPATLGGKYLSLGSQWDSNWYAYVVNEGYRNDAPANSRRQGRANYTFFPGYPLTVAAVRKVTGLSLEASLLAAAHAAAWGFWVYFLLLCRRWRVSAGLTAGAVAAVLAFPSAFYFTAGYTEALFSCSLLGMVYWSGDTRKYSWIPACLHGFFVGFTKMAGIAAAVFPLAAAWASPASRRKHARACAIAGACLAGTALFIGYIHLRFGSWALYFQAANAPGWNQHVTPWAIFDPAMYRLFLPRVYKGVPLPDDVGRVSYPLMLAAISLAAACDWVQSARGRTSGMAQRIPLYACAAAFWLLYAMTRYHNPAGSIRYMLPPFVVLALAAVHQLGWSKHGRIHCLFDVLLSFAVVLFAAVQILYIGWFTSGIWVA